MFIKKLAKKVGTSDSNLNRWAKQNGVSINALKYPDATVHAVTAYYSNNGRVKTETRFPGICVRSIVERYPVKPRQIRWKESEIILAAKMAGLVAMERQARIFNRPNANIGSIRSLWVKKFRNSGGGIHGLSDHQARHLLKPGYPIIRTQFWVTRNRLDRDEHARKLVLWCDMGPWLKRGTPKFIREAVKSMAQFQCWLFESSNPKRQILKLLVSA
jgi:hypothetical protein